MKNNKNERNLKLVGGLINLSTNNPEEYELLINDIDMLAKASMLNIKREEYTDTILHEEYLAHSQFINLVKEVIRTRVAAKSLLELYRRSFADDTLFYIGVSFSVAGGATSGLNKIKLAVAEVIKSAVDSGNLNELKELSDFGNSFKGMEQLPKDRDYRNLELGDWILIIEGKFDFNKLPMFQGDRPVTLDSAVNQQTAQNNQQQTPVGIKVKK